MTAWEWAILVLGLVTGINVVFLFLLMAVLGDQIKKLEVQRQVTLLLAREVDSALSTHGKNVASIAEFLIKAFDVAKPGDGMKN